VELNAAGRGGKYTEGGGRRGFKSTRERGRMVKTGEVGKGPPPAELPPKEVEAMGGCDCMLLLLVSPPQSLPKPHSTEMGRSKSSEDG